MSQAACPTERRFSIIIPHRNGEGVIRETLANLLEVTLPEDEIIVVDNGSSDGSVELIQSEFPDVRVHANPYNLGFGAACNEGLRATTGRFALLLNNDAKLKPGVLERFMTNLDQGPQIGLIGGQLIDKAGKRLRSDRRFPTFLSEIGLARTDRGTVTDQTGLIEVEQVAGACMAMRRAVLEKVGLLDERFFFYYEDTEFCLRMHRHGLRVCLDSGAEVIHDLQTSPARKRREAQLEYLRSRLIYYRVAFSPVSATLLTAYRVLRITLYCLTNLLGTLITLGQRERTRQKLVRNLYFLRWLLRGCPENWGLPGKPPG